MLKLGCQSMLRTHVIVKQNINIFKCLTEVNESPELDNTNILRIVAT
jgi:hypothetical protein